MSVRRVRGRVRNVEVGDRHLFTFEMRAPKYDLKAKTLDAGGVRFKRVRSRQWSGVTFQQIAERDEAWRRVAGRDVKAEFTDAGLKVTVRGEGGSTVIPWTTVASFGKRQQVMFKEDAK